MGLLNARPVVAANGKWVSKPAIFTIVAEILRREREENESAAGAETDKETRERDKKTER
jgi:hypothetical protein